MGGKGFRTVQSFGRSTGTEWMDDTWANRPAPSWNGIPQAVAPQQYGMASGFRSSLSPWAVGAGAAGLGAAALAPEEAEAAAIPDFEKLLPKIVTKDGRAELRKRGLLNDDGMMYAGTLEDPVFRAVQRRDPSITDNRVLLSRHAFDRHVLNNEMSMAEMTDGISDFLNSSQTRVLPNFPEVDIHKNPGKGMLAKKGPKMMVGPFTSGENGEFVFKSVFEPFGPKKEFVARQLERPATSPIFVTQGKPLEQSNTQLPGFSVVSQSAQKSSLPALSVERNAIIPLTPGGIALGLSEAGVAGMGGAGHASHTASEPGFWPGMARQFGLGTRGVLEGLGSAATLGFADPGAGISDLLGLPAPETDWERWRVGLNRGASDAMASIMMGSAAARMSPSPLVRGIGRELADKPMQSAGIGGLLGALGEVQPDIDLDDIGGLLGLLTVEEKEEQDSPRR